MQFDNQMHNKSTAQEACTWLPTYRQFL